MMILDKWGRDNSRVRLEPRFHLENRYLLLCAESGSDLRPPVGPRLQQEGGLVQAGSGFNLVFAGWAQFHRAAAPPYNFRHNLGVPVPPSFFSQLRGNCNPPSALLAPLDQGSQRMPT